MFPRSVEQAFEGRTLLPHLFDAVEHRLETRTRQKTCLQAEISVFEVKGRTVLGARLNYFKHYSYQRG